jgi:hypothetical protein
MVSQLTWNLLVISVPERKRLRPSAPGSQQGTHRWRHWLPCFICLKL